MSCIFSLSEREIQGQQFPNHFSQDTKYSWHPGISVYRLSASYSFAFGFVFRTQKNSLPLPQHRCVCVCVCVCVCTQTTAQVYKPITELHKTNLF